jgi:acetyl esterase
MVITSKKRGRARSKIVLALAFALTLTLASSSCATIKRYYLDNVDTKYAELRILGTAVAPAALIRMAEVETASIPGPIGSIACKIYRPLKIRQGAPVLLYLHGGGYVIGSSNERDRVARGLAAGGRNVVVSIDYALAPEHPYPAALRDCDAAFEWIEARASSFSSSPERIVVAGDSAGGNLSAVLCQLRRDEGKGMPLAQILFSPALGDVDPDTGRTWPSRIENARRSFLSPKSVATFYELYLGDPLKYRADPYVNPIMAKDFSALPRALVVSCEKDILRDEAEAYARKLSGAGVEAVSRRFLGVDHAYQGREVIALASEFLRSL